MFLDTSIIIEIFQSKKKDRRFEEIYKLIKDESLFISMIQIGEISDWCLNNNINPLERISKLEDIVNIIPLNKNICFEGSKIKFEMRRKGVSKFSLVDGIILASAESINQMLLTIDKDFKKAEGAIVL